MTTLARTFLGMGFLGAMLVMACDAPDKGELERSVSTRASPGSFGASIGGVSAVIEKRCGSLDCHGNPARNMRVYSARGLRLPNDAGLAPGVGETTLEEVAANYQSLLTLEPELTNKVLESSADPYTLLLLKKPLEIEKHKGGAVIKRNDDAELCISSWLKEDRDNPVKKDECARAATFPKE